MFFGNQLIHLANIGQASTIPLAAMTAAIGLYRVKNLGLPPPWDSTTIQTPLIVYGASSAVVRLSIFNVPV